ncbi:MAG: type II secretion system F family protein [Candidatus Gracilibacteria bacterium]|nr:type II secretion system F family protein [Candidatus Gracilibacteria bacterium]
MSENLIILDSGIENQKEGKAFSFSLESINDWIIARQRISLNGKVMFFRLLSTMVNAGISILKAISILDKQEQNPILKKLYSEIIHGIRSGKNLSTCLRDYDDNFTDSECSIIESGEKTGKLNSALIQLADQVEKIENMTKKIKGALIYPVAIIFVMFGAVSVLMTLVVPKIVEIFGDKSKLPPLTQILIGTSDFFVNYLWLIIMFVIGFIIFIGFWKKTPYGKYKFDQFMLYIPIFGSMNRKVVLSKFARVLSNLLGNGISIVESLRIVSDIAGNEVYRQRIMLLREDIKKGIKIGESLEDDALFPDMLVQMIKVGEETAKLDTIIIKIADFYDDEVETTINNIQKLLEPIIIVTMAVVIGFIAIGIMQPIMNLSEIVSNN